MGLLDNGNLDAQTIANLQLAGGLLSPGSFGQGLQRGLDGYQNTLTNDSAIQLRKAQIMGANLEAAQKELAIRRTMAQLDEAQAWQKQSPGLAPDTTPSPAFAALTAGASQGSVGPTVQNAARMDQLAPAQQSLPAPSGPSLPAGVAGYSGMPLEQLRARMNAGLEPKEALDLWKAANQGVAMNAGQYRMLPGQPMQYLPDPTKGIALGTDGSVLPMKGAAQTLGDIAAATKGGEMRGTNQNTPVPLDRLDRMPGLSPFSTIDDLINPKVPTTPSGADPFAGMSPTQKAQVLADARANGLSSFKVNGAPVSLTAPAATYKTPADLEAERVTAANTANLATKPALTSADTNALNVQNMDKDYADKLNARVDEGFNLKRRNAEITQQMNDYSTGIASADTRTHIASNLINMFPGNATIAAAAQKINGGSVVSAQTLNSLVAGAMVTNAIQVLDGQGRLTKAITQQLQSAAESASTDPNALKRIMSIQNRFADQDFAEQQARAQAIKAGTYNPATWQADMQAKKWQGLATPDDPTYSPVTPTPSIGGFRYLGKQ